MDTKQQKMTKRQYPNLLICRLHNLRVRADELIQELDYVEGKALELTGEDSGGFTSDYILGNNTDLNYLLEKLNIEVKE